jgi:hypothetical protein
MNQADFIFAIADLQDRLEDQERDWQRRWAIMEDGYTHLLGRNHWNLSDYERVVGWRLLQHRLYGTPWQELVHQFPPEEKAAAPERYVAPKVESVMDA